jgi:hypothetical protein
MQPNNQENNPITALYSGPIIAATLAPLLGFYTLMISHHVSRVTKELDKMVHAFGYWIPGSLGNGPDGSIGSYAGKETLALGVWFLSWALFHLLWKQQELPVKRWIPVFLGAITFVTLCLFHPFIDPIIMLILGTG